MRYSTIMCGLWLITGLSSFDYEFIAGRPFTQEEYDARRWVSVITERMALQLFGTTDVVGKEYQSNFFSD